MEADSDVAFDLQVQEAIAASLLDGAVSPPDVPHDGFNCEQELLDQYMTEAEAERLRIDLQRQIHDRAFACEILNVPEEEWMNNGDNLSRPYGEGSSSSTSGRGSGFKVYVNGLVEGTVGGIGVAICDGNDGLVFELTKGFNGKDQQGNEVLVAFKALTEGLDAAVMLDLKMISIVTDNPVLFQYITGKNPPITENVATLGNQINLLIRKLSYPVASVVSINDMKFAVELARKAIAYQVNHSTGNNNTKNLTESCAICMEDTYVDQMFLITGCQHSYCFSCMSRHVQFKLLQGILPKCPYEKCVSQLILDSCEKFLSPELIDIMRQRVKEASIPLAERVYCPYPRCSTILSKTELQGSVDNANAAIEILGCRKCPKCSGKFCINCKVPWHSNMNCLDFKRRNPFPSSEEQKLKNLATQNLWRECPKCNHMVSLAAGCYHIYCRCGHEFCYKCGAEWKKKKATCNCPIWDERNIVYQQ